MNKRYELHPVDKGYVMVDDKATDNYILLSDRRNSFYREEFAKMNTKIIAAHSSLNLLLPILPDFTNVEEDIDKLALKEYPINIIKLAPTFKMDSNHSFRDTYVKGYKAAQSKGKLYTEEDMVKFAQYNYKMQNSHPMFTTDDNLKEYIKSLSTPKIPKAVIVEVEYYDVPGEPGESVMRYTKPKVDENNNVIIKEIIY